MKPIFKSQIKFSRHIPHVQEDMIITCQQQHQQPQEFHQHLCHSFPLYVLSPYFHKAIIFNNKNNNDENHNNHKNQNIKQIHLPYSCQIIDQLIEFAYDGQLKILSSTTLSSKNNQIIEQILSIAKWTSSIRLINYIEHYIKFKS